MECARQTALDLLAVLLIGTLVALPATSGQLTASTSNVSVAFLQEANLRCSLTGYSGSDPVTIGILKTNGSHSTALFTVEGLEGTLNIIAGQYADSGEYSCTVTIVSQGGNQTLSSSFFFEVKERLVFLSQPTNQLEAPVGSVRRLLCHPNLGQVVLWRKNGIDIVFDERVTQFNLGMTINRVDYSDIGRYTCVVDYMGVLQDASANITVQGYVPPSGTVGFGYVKSSETPVLECSVGGVPGPTEIYWQRGQELNAIRVTTQTNTTIGPFVDSAGRLDLTRARANDTDFYRCTGVDVAGGSGSQLFRVEVVAGDVFVLWTQWYFILLYCVIGVILIATVVLVIWCCYGTRRQWWIKVTRVIKVKKRVRRHTTTQRMPLDDDIEAIDNYAR